MGPCQGQEEPQVQNGFREAGAPTPDDDAAGMETASKTIAHARSKSFGYNKIPRRKTELQNRLGTKQNGARRRRRRRRRYHKKGSS